MSIIKFGFDDESVLLKYESGQKVDGEYGTQYKWSCNEDDIFYATEHLNALLTHTGVKAGDRVKIGKEKHTDISGKEITRFKVNGLTFNELLEKNKNNPQASSPQPHMVNSASNDRLDKIESRLSAIEKQLNVDYTDQADSKDSVTDEDIPF
tara:strand:+ start:1123 stop:1578 length:456 start_codon:yes stop_codon:yes gene_type:complete